MNPYLLTLSFFLAGCAGNLVFGINKDVDEDGDLRDKDCNDLNASQAHGNFEWADDGLDNNCDDQIDEPNSLALLIQKTYSTIVSALFTNFDDAGYDELLIGNPEGTESREGGVVVLSKEGQVIDTLLGVNSYDQFGSSLIQCAGSLVFIGALGADVAGTASGSVSLLQDQEVTYDVVSGSASYANAGASLACVRGEEEAVLLAVGEPGVGQVRVIENPQDTPTQEVVLLGSDQFGSALAGADVNGDGLGDLVVGSPQEAHDDGIYSGSASLYLNPPTSDPDAVLVGETSWMQIGSAVSSAGDVDGDGYADLLIGAPGAEGQAGISGAGAVYLVAGNPNLTSGLASDVASATFLGQYASQQAGISVASLGDINADGWDDLFISGLVNDQGLESQAQGFVFLGGPDVKGALSLLNSQADFGGDQNASYMAAAGRGTVAEGIYYDSPVYEDFAVLSLDSQTDILSGNIFSGQAYQTEDKNR